MVVYFHRNPVNNEIFYVGIGKRRRAFESGGRNVIWKNYVKKYGGRVVEIVHENLSIEQAYKLEIEYISFYKRRCDGGRLVNITEGGERNAMHIPEVVEKIRQANLGKKHSEETRRKQSLAKKGKPSTQPKGYRHSSDVIERLKIINKEIASRPEVIAKNRLNKLGKRNKGKHTPVLMIDIKTNEVVKTFECIMDACKYFGKPKSSNITTVIKGRRYQTFGYRWELASQPGLSV